MGHLTSPLKLYAKYDGKGPVVLMISGKTGTALYAPFARRLAETGYYVLLYDGNDFPFNQTEDTPE